MTYRPTPYQINKNCYNLRRKAIVCYNGYGSNTDGSISHRTRPKVKSILEKDNVTKKKHLQRKTSTSSESSYYSTSTTSTSTDSSSSGDSLSSTKSSIVSSGYETLKQTTYKTNQKDVQTIMVQPEQSLEKSAVKDEDVSTHVENTTTTYGQLQQLHVRFSNVPANVGKFNVRVQFTNVTPQWLTNIYRSYEDDLWQKQPRLPPVGKSRWFYNCSLCQKQLCQFGSLKTHLNQHMELYPYVCKICSKSYTNRSSMVFHLRTLHHINKEHYNIYIGQ